MKKKLLLLFILYACLLTKAQTINFPDTNLKYALLASTPIVDTNADGEIQLTEATATTHLFIAGFPINNLSGLENFTNLTYLQLTFYTNSHADFSSLTNLQTLIIEFNPFNTIDISGLTQLTYLNCGGCMLQSLDLSDAIHLQYLNCSMNNELTELDLSGLTELTTLDCSALALTQLDLTDQINLTSLNCNFNRLTTLEVGHLINLNGLDCSNNRIDSTYPGISALNVAPLTNLNYLNCSDNNLSSLDVGGLTNLVELNCNENHLTELNVTNLTLLTSLHCGGNQLTTLDVANLWYLNTLYCHQNQITSLDVSTLVNLNTLYVNYNMLTELNVTNLVNLQNLYFAYNNISTIDLSNLVLLYDLFCPYNQLTTLDLSNLHNLFNLSCSFNQISDLDFSNLHKIGHISVSGNLFTQLDFSHIGPDSDTFIGYNIDFSNNPNLTYVNLKYNYNTDSIFSNNCPNLIYICADEQYLNLIEDLLVYGNEPGSNSSTVLENIQVNSYCSFIPGGTNNSITGQFTIDTNNNGCDASDYLPKDIKIVISDGTSSGATFSNASGNYFFYNQTGNFTLTPQFENNPYFTISPTSATFNFPILDGSSEMQNFCITTNGIHSDVEINVLPTNSPRPGFDSFYQIIYKNKGNQVLSGAINFTFDDAVQDFVSATPNVATQSTNNLSWNYTNLLPFESRTINLVLNVNAPTEAPPVNINDILTSGVSIDSTPTDEYQEDNIFSLNQTVIGSYDPNDKTCLEGDTIPPTKVGDYLHYLIRFQNSGTAPAENVVVKDMIDTNKFDLASLQLTSTSHPQVTRITGNKVEFVFENIQLPAEQDDEPGSHGYVAFKIRTKNNLVLGNTVSNTADIYFDYNFPIVTNTASTTIAVLSVNEFENASVSIVPNPVKNNLTISAADVISSVQMYDVQGRLIATQLNNTTSTTLNMSQQNTGVYFVKVITENGVKVEKIIKE